MLGGAAVVKLRELLRGHRGRFLPRSYIQQQRVTARQNSDRLLSRLNFTHLSSNKQHKKDHKIAP